MALLDGQVAVVTGGGSGIGRACCQFLARDGARVVVADIDERAGQETVSLVQGAGGQAAFVRVDTGSPESNQAMVDFVVRTFTRLDIAVNNAGIGGESNLVGDMSPEGWQRVIGINLSGVFYGMRYEIPEMLKTGGGSIVNMASILGAVGFGSSAGYVAAKHGVVGLTRTAALDYATQGIRVNAVGPGFINTPLLSGIQADKDVLAAIVGMHPMARLGTSEEVAELVVWLSSPKASFVTGSYYNIDGGYLAK